MRDILSVKTDTKLIPGVTDMLKAAPFLHFFDGISIRILSPRLFGILKAYRKDPVSFFDVFAMIAISLRSLSFIFLLPILKACGIAGLVDPVSLFCAIEEHFSMEKTASETTEAKGTTDKDRAIMHGFDVKTSFRSNK